MAIYVMSDIHGQYETFKTMLVEIGFNKKDHLYILGDVIDRGPDGIKTLLYCMEHQDNITLLMGNHEDMMIKSINIFKKDEMDQMLNRDVTVNWLYCNGGHITYTEFLKQDNSTQSKIEDFLNNLSYYKIIENENKIKTVLIHAGLSTEYTDSLERILEYSIKSEDIIWYRDYYDSNLDYEMNHNPILKDTIVIHGHTPTADGKIQCINNRIYNIDCGCARIKNLGCLRLDDMKEFYIPVITEVEGS